MAVMQDGVETVIEEVVERHPANCDNTRLPDVYAGTWIAECTVVHPNTKLIQKFKHEKGAEEAEGGAGTRQTLRQGHP